MIMPKHSIAVKGELPCAGADFLPGELH
jgi:hypothetical protein